GRGLSPFEANTVNRGHGKALSEEEARRALAELERPSRQQAEKEG
ncbi:MAG: hypothetical protein HC915_20840, partial [Anaerolineae bacterium]|nr:hypothetical protein [Anaerolineae bacterium]